MMNNSTRRRIMSSSGILPDGYQPVQYLESTGTQYINTGINSNKSTGFLIDFQNTSSVSTDFGIIGTQSPNSLRFNIRYYDKYLFTYGVYSQVVASGSAYYNSRMKVECVKGQIKLNDAVIGGFSLPTGTNYSYPMYIFGTNSTTITLGSLKVYRCKFYSDRNITRDFIPCYRKSDMEPGMYEIINGQFYTNAGTGRFNVGNRI